MYNFFINLNDLLKISLLILFYMSILLGVHTMARGWHPYFWCVVFRGWGRIKKGPIFIKNHSKRDILSQITLKFSRAFWGVISALIKTNIDSGISKK